MLRDALISLAGEQSKQLTLAQHLDKELERLSKKKRDLEDMRSAQATDYEDRRGLIHEMERQVDNIFKEHESAKEQLAFQKSEKVRLDITIRKTSQDIKREHDLVLRVIREKDTQLKLHHRLETTVNNIKMSTPTILKQTEDYRRQYDQIKCDEKYYQKESQRLRKQIDLFTYDFLRQDKVEKKEDAILTELMQGNRELDEELEKVTLEAQNLSRTVDSIKMDKDIKVKSET